MSEISDEELQYLRICATCYTLYETDRPDGLNQRCRCGPRDEPRWPRFDFNERVSLCRCCGTVALPSGSRWSSYFCRECQVLAMDVSIAHRRLVIPIGRHSLMHTFVPPANPPTPVPLDEHQGDLGDRLISVAKSISSGTGVLQQWSTRAIAYNLEYLGLPGGVQLTEYLAAVSKKGTGRARLAAFAGLCESVKAAEA